MVTNSTIPTTTSVYDKKETKVNEDLEGELLTKFEE